MSEITSLKNELHRLTSNSVIYEYDVYDADTAHLAYHDTVVDYDRDIETDDDIRECFRHRLDFMLDLLSRDDYSSAFDYNATVVEYLIKANAIETAAIEKVGDNKIILTSFMSTM